MVQPSRDTATCRSSGQSLTSTAVAMLPLGKIPARGREQCWSVHPGERAICCVLPEASIARRFLLLSRIMPRRANHRKAVVKGEHIDPLAKVLKPVPSSGAKQILVPTMLRTKPNRRSRRRGF